MKPYSVGLLLVSCIASLGQQSANKAAFEVATVHPSDPNRDSGILVPMSLDPSVVRYNDITLRDATRGAFRVRDFQVVAPDWMADTRFQIEGKLPDGATVEQAPEMLQTLLAERFKLETRREMKEMNVYALVVAKDGFKLKPSEQKFDSSTPMAMGTDGRPRRIATMSGSAGDVTIHAPGATILTFVGIASRFTEWPVVDLTGLDGLYDLNIRFAPEVNPVFRSNPDAPPITDPAPTLADAVKQLGLRLEKRKMPVEMVVVTHMERTPTDN